MYIYKCGWTIEPLLLNTLLENSLDPASLVWEYSEAIAGITYQRVWMDFIMIEYTSFSNPDLSWPKRKLMHPARQYQSVWGLLGLYSYLQLSELTRNIATVLLEKKKTQNWQKNSCRRRQMAHIYYIIVDSKCIREIPRCALLLISYPYAFLV